VLDRDLAARINRAVTDARIALNDIKSRLP